MHPHTARFRRLAPALLSLLCAVGPSWATDYEAPPPSLRNPQPGEGIVLLSVGSNAAEAGQFDVVTLRRTDLVPQVVAGRRPPGPDEYLLRQVSRGQARNLALLVGVLPAGRYQVVRYAHDTRSLSLSPPPAGVELLGQFRVEAGRTTDLGRITVTPFEVDVLAGRGSDPSTNAEWLQQLSPDDAALIGTTPPLSWEGPKDSRDIADSIARIAPVGVNSVLQLTGPPARTLFATRMGQVLVRSADGKWARLNSGVSEEFQDVYQTAAGDLLAAGELNALIAFTGDTPHRIPVSGLPLGTILRVFGSDAHGWYVLHQRGTVQRLYRSKSLAAQEWQSVQDFGSDALWHWHTPAGLGVASTADGLRYLDAATGEWRKSPLPECTRLLDIRPGHGEALGILCGAKAGFAGVFAHAQVRESEAGAWREITPAKKIRAVAPTVLANNVIVMESLDYDRQSGGYAMQLSRDGGQTWKVTNTGLQSNVPLHALPDGTLYATSTLLGTVEQIFESMDQGETWKLVHSSYVKW